MSTVRLFVYGSLMRGERNYGQMFSGRFMGTARTSPRYTLVLAGPYPGLLEGGRTAVTGELFEVDDAQLGALDEFEGHPDWYCRQAVVLEDDTEAQAYFLVDTTGVRPIASGDWRADSRNGASSSENSEEQSEGE